MLTYDLDDVKNLPIYRRLINAPKFAVRKTIKLVGYKVIN